MKRIISILLLFFVLASGGVSFAADRWVTVESTQDYSRYIDSQTIAYNKADNSVMYWIKVQNSRYTFLEQYICYLGQKKRHSLRAVTYKQGVLQRSTDNPGQYGVNIYPDSSGEKEVNAVCSIIGTAPIFGVSTHHWKWFYSTDQITYTICVDQKDYDPTTGRALIYVKKTYLNGSHWTQAYVCNLKENTITTAVDESNNDQKYIVPDSIEERIFNAAVSLCRQ